MQSAKSFVIDYRRDSQLSYSLMKIGQPHHDELVQKVQDWIEQHFHEEFTLNTLAEHFNVTTRTLIRHFKQALNIAPNQYLQAIRIEAARKRLEKPIRHRSDYAKCRLSGSKFISAFIL